MLAGNDVVQLKHKTWTAPSTTDPDVNTESLQEAITDAVYHIATGRAAGKVIEIESAGRTWSTIPIRPNIIPDLTGIAGGSTTVSGAGLILQGGGAMKTCFEVQYDGTPAADYYFWNPNEHTDVSADGLLARCGFRDFSVVPEGNDPFTLSTIAEATASDDDADPIWKYFVGFFVDKWNKQHSFKDLMLHGMRRCVVAGTPGSYNGDELRFDNIETRGCGTFLTLNSTQAMAYRIKNCTHGYVRRDLIEVLAGGGGMVMVDGNSVFTDQNINDESTDWPYEALYYLVRVAGDAASDCRSGAYIFRDLIGELRGSFGHVYSVPTVSDGLVAETRERFFVFDNCDLAKMQKGPALSYASDGGGRGRIIAQLGMSQMLEYRGGTTTPRYPGINVDDEDYAMWRFVVEDQPSGSGGSLAQAVANNPPTIKMAGHGGSKDIASQCFQFCREDGSASAGLARLVIDDHRTIIGGSVLRTQFGSWTKHAEDVNLPTQRTQLAEAQKEITVSVWNHRAQTPGTNSTELNWVYLPPCEVLGGEIYLPADGLQTTDAVKFQIVDQDGNVLVETASQDGQLAFYVNNIGDQAPVKLDGPLRRVRVVAVPTGSTALRSDKELIANIRYRGLRPVGSVQYDDPSPWRIGYPFSVAAVDCQTHYYPCNEGDFAEIRTSVLTAVDQGNAFTQRNLAATASPSNTSDGTLGRYVKEIDGDGQCVSISSVSISDFLLGEDYSIAGWVYCSDNNSDATLVSVGLAAGDRVEIHYDSQSTASNIVFKHVVSGVTTTLATLAITADTWTPILLRKKATQWDAFCGNNSDTGATALGITGTPDHIRIGNAASGSNHFRGRFCEFSFFKNHFLSDADWTLFKVANAANTFTPQIQ